MALRRGIDSAPSGPSSIAHTRTPPVEPRLPVWLVRRAAERIRAARVAPSRELALLQLDAALAALETALAAVPADRRPEPGPEGPETT